MAKRVTTFLSEINSSFIEAVCSGDLAYMESMKLPKAYFHGYIFSASFGLILTKKLLNSIAVSSFGPEYIPSTSISKFLWEVVVYHFCFPYYLFYY